MKRNTPASGNDSGKIAGLILLALIWIWLVYMLFSRGGMTFYNLFIAVATGIIIFVPLWKRYIQPILDKRKKS